MCIKKEQTQKNTSVSTEPATLAEELIEAAKCIDVDELAMVLEQHGLKD